VFRHRPSSVAAHASQNPSHNRVTTTDRVIRGFKYVPVFDIAQTDGEELPSVCNRLVGDDPAGIYARLLTVAGSIGFTVEDHEFSGSTNGDCCHAEHRIRVETRNTPAQRVKTLAHEIAHALLHEQFDSRSLAELEAESTAFIVMSTFGISAGEYSFGYCASWAQGGEDAISAIRASATRIQQAPARIIDACEADRFGISTSVDDELLLTKISEGLVETCHY
jgi:IrrE N-terminal-like domain